MKELIIFVGNFAVILWQLFYLGYGLYFLILCLFFTIVRNESRMILLWLKLNVTGLGDYFSSGDSGVEINRKSIFIDFLRSARKYLAKFFLVAAVYLILTFIFQDYFFIEFIKELKEFLQAFGGIFNIWVLC